MSGYITNLAVILREAQGVINDETGKDIDIGGEVILIRQECDAFRARIAHLEALIKDAPHSETCACLGFGDCDCFKAGV